jgi:hypothetical protein
MGDMAEGWAEWREKKQKKKRSNMAASTAMLTGAGVSFQSHNSGVHLVLSKGEELIDFWPSTGLWWIRGTSNKRRGIQKLIQHMKRAA